MAVAAGAWVWACPGKGTTAWRAYPAAAEGRQGKAGGVACRALGVACQALGVACQALGVACQGRGAACLAADAVCRAEAEGSASPQGAGGG